MSDIEKYGCFTQKLICIQNNGSTPTTFYWRSFLRWINNLKSRVNWLFCPHLIHTSITQDKSRRKHQFLLSPPFATTFRFSNNSQMQNTAGQITHQEAIWKISNSTMALLPTSSEKNQIKYPLDLPAQSVEPSNWRIRESFKKPMGAQKNCSTFVHLNLSNEANFKKLFKK